MCAKVHSSPSNTDSNSSEGQSESSKVSKKGSVNKKASNVSTELKSTAGSDGGGGGVRLEKTIGLWNGCAVIIGIVVGSGIFISPKGN